MKKEKRKLFLIGMSILLVFILLIGVTYAWMSFTLKGTKVNVLRAGNLSLILDDENSVGISDENAMPMLDKNGSELNPYHFTLENHGDEYIEYTIYFDDEALLEDETRIEDNKIKYNLVKNGNSKIALLSAMGEHPNRILDHGIISGRDTYTYDLRLWLDQDAGNEVIGKVLKGKLRVEASQVKETVLNESNLNMTVVGTNEISLGKNTPLADNEGEKLEPYQFTVKNTTNTESNYAIILDDVSVLDTRSVGVSDDKIKYQLKKNNVVVATDLLSETIVGENRVIDTGIIASGATNNYELRLWLDESVSSEEASGITLNGSLRIVSEKRHVANNEHIVAIYPYDVSRCQTGEEATCVRQTSAPNTYTPGTIVKYQVNDHEIKYFHVISDNGANLTMQQRENTIYATEWYAAAMDNTKGPLTVLSALESATSTWTNVNDQNYAMGTTPFNNNKFTACTYNPVINCTTNKYTLQARTAKARMITAQEAEKLGCTSTERSCPVWMINYLFNSTGYGGTVNVAGGKYGENQGYWTMSAYASENTSSLHTYFSGRITYSNTKRTWAGARAVVVIDK